MRPLLLCLIAFLASSCVMVEQADLVRHFEDSGLRVSQGDPPAQARPLMLVAAHTDGFYILGLVPLIPVSLELCVSEIVTRARRVGADGISNLQLNFQPASALKFSTFPIPDWSASLSVSGMAYKLER